MTMIYTQGGYLVDPLPCWTNGDGHREPKPNGCLSLKVPSEDWIRNPTGNRPVNWQDAPVRKVGGSTWDVTDLFRGRHVPGLGQLPTGYGYMLIGDPLDVGGLTADDNTRCTSALSDVRLEVTFTVPPVSEQYNVVPPN